MKGGIRMEKIKSLFLKNKGKIYFGFVFMVVIFIISLFLPVSFGFLIFPFLLVLFFFYIKGVEKEPWIIDEKKIAKEIEEKEEDLKIINEHLKDFPQDLDVKFRKREIENEIEEIKKKLLK